jgi:hypothetical protein
MVGEDPVAQGWYEQPLGVAVALARVWVVAVGAVTRLVAAIFCVAEDVGILMSKEGV